MDAKKQLNVLLVEDDEGHALLIEETLRKCLDMQKVHRARDGEAGLLFIHRKNPKPDLILLDIKLPKLDGYGVLKSLKNDKEYQSIPIIIISSTANQAEINYCYQLGVTGYIIKPIRYEELRQKIKGLGEFLSVVSLPEQGYTGHEDSSF